MSCMVRNSRKSRAAHEAGHAIALYTYGLSWECFVVNGDGHEQDRTGGTYYEDSTLDLRQRGILYMAGMAGMYLYHDRALPKRLTVQIVKRDRLVTEDHTGDFEIALAESSAQVVWILWRRIYGCLLVLILKALACRLI